jgi:catechol 2,3-dioxygenase
MLLPASTHIGRAALQVADLERSLSFYRDLVGFREVARSRVGGRASADLGTAGSEHAWLTLTEKPGAKRVPRGGLLGLYHCAVLLPSRGDLGRFFVQAVNHGAMIASANHLVSEALYLTDPDGLTLEVYRDLPRDDWQYAQGEISMASLPLDTDALVASAKDAPEWHGLPAGTTIGHMHFYVGDLTNADTFYHEGIGFDRMNSSYPGALFVSAGGYHHHVGLNTWAAHSRAATDDDAKLLWWELVVPDAAAIDEIAAKVGALGYRVESLENGIQATDAWGIVVRILSGSEPHS